MKNLSFLILLTFPLFFTHCKNENDSTSDSVINEKKIESSSLARDGVFIHITESYNDPHRVLMPLKMANLMAEDKDVIVYFDIHAVEFLVREAKDIQYADFESAQTYIRLLNDKKVGIYACPTCLKIAGFNPDDLIEGVQIAEKDKFFSFTKGRIITLDY